MDIKDFEGLTKYKLCIPLLYIISWSFMFLGPVYFPVVYQKLYIAFFIYMAYKILWIMITMIIVLMRSWPLINRANEQSSQNQYNSVTGINQQINYGFIIPNYKQQISLISQTLEVLAAHKRAKSQYMVFLAMQAHQQGSKYKAQQLVQTFKNHFKIIDYTIHAIRSNQQKGKASNVSWCAQNMQKNFQKYMVNPDSVILTIMDVDSWAPNVYFDVLQQKIYQEYAQRNLRIYQPMQIFTRNNLQVPLFTRVMDIFHSYASMSSLWSYYDLTYPLSNYSLSYNLVKRIGFWDTCADAIGEDLHTTLKALWKTKMQVKCIPIYIPFNQVNISTGNGYWQDLKAKFWQAQRHAKGVSQVAYCSKMFFNSHFKFKNLLVYQFILQLFSVPAVFPWLLISMNFQNQILYRFYKASPQLLIYDSVSCILTAMTIFGTIGYLLYQVVKRRANKIIYKQQNQSIFRILEYGLLFIVVFFFVSVPTFVIATFSVLFGRQQYIVAEKKLNVKKQLN